MPTQLRSAESSVDAEHKVEPDRRTVSHSPVVSAAGRVPRGACHRAIGAQCRLPEHGTDRWRSERAPLVVTHVWRTDGYSGAEIALSAPRCESLETLPVQKRLAVAIQAKDTRAAGHGDPTDQPGLCDIVHPIGMYEMPPTPYTPRRSCLTRSHRPGTGACGELHRLFRYIGSSQAENNL